MRGTADDGVRHNDGMRVVLFDVDGVLLDSRATHRELWRRWADLRSVDFAVVSAASTGRRPVETIRAAAPHLDAVAEDAILTQMLAEMGTEVLAYRGAQQLLHALAPDRWGVVTGGREQTVLHHFRANALPEPAVLIDADAVDIGKPNPDGYLRAARAFDVDPADCLVVEDAPVGVTAGKSAGMLVLAIASTHQPTQLKEADQCVTDLHAALAPIVEWLAVSGSTAPRTKPKTVRGALTD
jgi:sugar-phosphatase